MISTSLAGRPLDVSNSDAYRPLGLGLKRFFRETLPDSVVHGTVLIVLAVPYLAYACLGEGEAEAMQDLDDHG